MATMDNVETTQVSDNSDAQTSGSTGTATTAVETSTVPSTAPAGWKNTINADLRNSPLLQKFEDTPDGLNKALESHANLEKLLGHEKVPIPKDANDVEGWNRFSKAMGIPNKATEYGLPDAQLPEGLKEAGLGISKDKFAEIMHAHKQTPAQAKALWSEFNRINVENYNNAMKAHQEQIVKTVNTLKGEWGDAYETNVELGQMVINKFSDSQEMNDYVTSVLSKDPHGIKFLAKIGDQFAENKIGEFQMKRFSLAPEQARDEWHKITRDPNHPYNNDKATPRERQAAIDQVNALIKVANGIK